MVETIGSAAGTTTASTVEIEKRRLKESCEEFESFLTANLLKTMRESIMRGEEPENDREVYESMMDQTFAKEISHSKGLGLGETLYRQLSPSLKTNSENG